jgi:hypothetical protein
MFHPLVTKAIDEGTYRPVNYERLMNYKIVLSRWLTKRISHYFTQANIDNPYKIKLSTIIRDSGMKRYQKISHNITQVIKSLNEMVKFNTLSKYKVFRESEESKKRKIKDAIFDLYVSDIFTDEIKKANKLINLKGRGDRIDDAGFNKTMEEIKKELEDPIYCVSRTMINNIIAKIRDNEQQQFVINALAAARKYISLNPCNAAAITRAALRDGWTPGEVKKVTAKQIEKSVQSLIEVEIPEIKLDNQNPIWVKILEIVKKDLNKEEFEQWFSTLGFVAYQDNILFLAAETKFFRDNIKKDHLVNFEKSFKKVVTDLKKIKIRSLDDDHYL